jgi:glycosyltransferase involved in cell wall biosynthesis
LSKAPDPAPLLMLMGNDVPTVLNLRMNLIRSLQDAGYRVGVAAPPMDASSQLEAAGIAFHPVRMLPAGTRPTADAALFWQYVRLLRSERPAAILGFTVKPNVYGSLAARLCGIPALNNITGLGTAFITKGPLESLVTALYRPALRKAEAVFFHNEDDRDLFVGRKIVRSEQAIVIPGSGIDLSRFEPEPLPGKADAPVFLLIGRLINEKGVREFVDAATRLKSDWPNSRFQLLGDFATGPRAVSREELERWVATGTLEYLGSSSDVRPFIAGADCLVLPSYREGLPRSLLEGAAMGRALVATDAPGCRNLVDPGITGYLCDVRSAPSLAGAMENFLRLTPDQRVEMGGRARQMVEERFSDERVNKAYLEVLQGMKRGGR